MTGRRLRFAVLEETVNLKVSISNMETSYRDNKYLDFFFFVRKQCGLSVTERYCSSQVSLRVNLYVML